MEAYKGQSSANPLLFPKSFEFETTLTLEECKDQLWTLHNPRQNLSQNFGSTAEIACYSDYCLFDIRFKRRNRTWEYTTAHALGEFKTDPITGKTIVHGYVKFGIYYFLIAILTPIFSFLFLSATPSSRHPFFGLLVLAAIGISWYIWSTLADDTRKLRQTLYATLVR